MDQKNRAVALLVVEGHGAEAFKKASAGVAQEASRALVGGSIALTYDFVIIYGKRFPPAPRQEVDEDAVPPEGWVS